MSDQKGEVNTIAPLTNVALFSELVTRVMNRAPGLPGLGLFFGPSGYGKTVAATYAANKHRAYLVQVKSVWSAKKLCSAILAELGVRPIGTIGDMVDAIGAELSTSRRPLLIDEAHILASKRLLGVVHDIYESCHGTIILSGEEMLPKLVETWERVHGRVLHSQGAQPVSLGDIRFLTRPYCPGVEVADDLLASMHAAIHGSVRRAVVNLARVAEEAAIDNRTVADLAWWGDRGWFTGAAPAPRRG